MAYPAVVSLKQTINDRLQNSSSPINSEILESAKNHTTSLKQLLSDSNNRRSLAALDGEIRDCAHQLEDALEFHEFDEFYSLPKEEEDKEEDEDDDADSAIASLAEKLKKLELEYIEVLSKQHNNNDDDDDVAEEDVLSYPNFGVEEMVGNFQEFNNIRRAMLCRLMPHELCFFLVHGRVGSGGKIIANTLFEDLRKEFDCCARVSLGREYQLKEFLEQILAQLDNDLVISSEDEDELYLWNYLCQVLEHRKYLIMLDDVHDEQLVKYLTTSLPNRSNGSSVFITSSLGELMPWCNIYFSLEMSVHYFEEIMLQMLMGLVFDDETVPQEMKEVGKKIIQNCGGSMLSVAKTVLFLLKTDKTVEEWRKIAEDQQNPLFILGDELTEMNTISAELQSCASSNVISLLVDFDKYVRQIKMLMKPDRFFCKMQIISLFGMAGIGKSTLARKIFDDESIVAHYDHRVWVTLGPKYQSRDVFIDILAQIYPSIGKKKMKEDAELIQNLCVQLSDKRCLIVLDDLWSKEPLCHLKNAFPNIMGSTLITTRLLEVAENGENDIQCEIKLLDEEESWCLFRQKVFDEQFFPNELEKAGRKIVEKCEGLPLLILTVADQLLKVDKAPNLELWNNVALGKEKSVFKNAHDEISKGLLPSYETLRQNLKACFLYIGAFRSRYEIPTSKLTNLWKAEGFLEPDLSQMFEDFAAKCISELVHRSMVMAHHSRVSNSQMKTCRLHTVFWHLSNSEAVKSKFYHPMNCYADCSIESITSQEIIHPQ